MNNLILFIIVLVLGTLIYQFPIETTIVFLICSVSVTLYGAYHSIKTK